MATVLGELDLEFTTADITATLETEVVAVDAGALSDPAPLLGIDLDALVALWGPLESLSWSVTVDPGPAVIPAPPALLCLAGALLWLAGVRVRDTLRRSRL